MARTRVGRTYRSKTLRQMPPVTRKVARLRGELVSIDRRLKTIIPELKEVERIANLTRAESIEVLERLEDATQK